MAAEFAFIRVDGLAETTTTSSTSSVESNVADAFHAVQPYLTEGVKVIKAVSAKHWYSAILLDNGSLMLFCPRVPELHTTTISCGNEFIVDVAAGYYHFLACSSSGSVYTFGYSNLYGQLGDGSLWRSEPIDSDIPIPLSAAKRIEGFGVAPAAGEAVAADMTRGSEASAGEVDITGITAGIPNPPGSEQSGGQPKRSVKHSPSNESKTKKRFVRGDISYEIEMEGKYPLRDPVRICAVACGSHHSLLLSAARNAVYACGRGHCGQLGGSRSVPMMATFRSIRLLFGLPVKSILAAGDHSFVLLATGKLLAFGENSCGQLGVGHCRKVMLPSAASYLPENETFIATYREMSSSCISKRLYDAKMYASLRAPYLSYESTHYPMRVQRVDEGLVEAEPFIVSMWGCETLTVLLTSEMKWMSCGLPLSRSSSLIKASGRFDGFGTLGRPLMRKEETYSFGYMHFSAAIERQILQSGYRMIDPSVDSDSLSIPPQVPAAQQLECHCFSHTVIVKVPGSTEEDSGSPESEVGATVFIQSNVVNTLVDVAVDSEGSCAEGVARTAENRTHDSNVVLGALRDCKGVDDDSYTFTVHPGTAMLPLNGCCVVL